MSMSEALIAARTENQRLQKENAALRDQLADAKAQAVGASVHPEISRLQVKNNELRRRIAQLEKRQ